MKSSAAHADEPAVGADEGWASANEPRSRRQGRNVPSPFPTAYKLKLPASILRPRPKPRSEPTRSEPAARLGTQIKSLRVAAGLSAGALSIRSAMSRSMLSRIENGLVSPPVELLDRIARALDVPLSRFFADPTDRADLSFVPAGKGIAVDRLGAVAGFRYELLGHLLSGNLFVEPYLVRVDDGAAPYASFQHPGLKFVYLLSGRVVYRYGHQVQALGMGDALLFDAVALHGVESVEEGPARYLSIVFTLRR